MVYLGLMPMRHNKKVARTLCGMRYRVRRSASVRSFMGGPVMWLGGRLYASHQ
nr:MAG TPA: hypothetical protein [Inoviridae sp.]